MIFKLPRDIEKLCAFLKTQKGTFKVEKQRKIRSLSQNRYLHVIFRIISDETGYSPDEIKEIYRMLFLSVEKEINGQKVVIGRSTTTLDTKEMTEFIENIRNHASRELGIYVPAPDDESLIEYYQKYF